MLKRTFGIVITWCRSLKPIVTFQLIMFMLFAVIDGSVSSYRLPEYNDTPSNVTYYKGDRAILQCSVRYLGTKQVIWKKVTDDFALTYGEMVFVSDPDFSIDHLPLRDEWNLVISNVQPKHAGLYECQISTKEDLRKYVQLNVLDEPIPRDEGIRITGKNFFEKGEKIVLTCNATDEHYPPEDIDWFKDGNKVRQNLVRGLSITKFRIAETKTLHSQLEIDKADMNDTGVYICRSSKLAIASMNIMVLNAETSHIKRENPGKTDVSASTSAACTVAYIMHNGNAYTHLLTLMCIVYVALHLCNRTL